MTLFLESGTGLHRVGHVQRDSSGTMVDIRVNENSFPFIHDWDEDSRKDLILGEARYNLPDTGNVRVYKNCGTDNQPFFHEHFLLQAGGQLLFQPRANPTIYDLDADGLKDLVLGNDNGFVYFYANIGTNEVPIFAAAYETLKTTEGGFIDALTESRLRLVDWNEDGDLDLLLGGQDGNVWIYENATDLPMAEDASRHAAVTFYAAPNPCRRAVQIRAGIGRTGLGLDLYDVSGRWIKTMSFNSSLNPHAQILTWDGTDQTGHAVPGGVYFARLAAKGQKVLKIIKIE